MAPRNRKKKHTPPSRQRYEADNPVVSVRVPKDLYDALARFKKRGLSFADVLKLGLELAEPDLEEAWNQGSIWGHDIGYEAAQAEYEVTYRCRRCRRCRRRHLSITTDDEKEAAASAMYQLGWHDPDCRICRSTCFADSKPIGFLDAPTVTISQFSGPYEQRFALSTLAKYFFTYKLWLTAGLAYGIMLQLVNFTNDLSDILMYDRYFEM